MQGVGGCLGEGAIYWQIENYFNNVITTTAILAMDWSNTSSAYRQTCRELCTRQALLFIGISNVRTQHSPVQSWSRDSPAQSLLKSALQNSATLGTWGCPPWNLSAPRGPLWAHPQPTLSALTWLPLMSAFFSQAPEFCLNITTRPVC